MMRKLHLLPFSLCFLSLCLLFSSFSRLFLEPQRSVLSNTDSVDAPVIIIDAGHGGIDGGAVGADGTAEKDLNLQISKKLAILLRLMGHTVVETRTEDLSLASEDAKKGHIKQSDLENRQKIAARYDKKIFVSIHMNAYPGVACEGLQVWYSEKDAASAEIAKAVQEGVKSALQPQNNRKIKPATSSIYLLRHATYPAILVECGFISNIDECKRLGDNLYQKQLVLAIAASISKNIKNSTCQNW